MVAGHVCLDVIPRLAGAVDLAPGRLVEAGPAVLAPGGAVANVGTALLRLGECTTLVGAVGNDHFGEILRARLASLSAELELRFSEAAGHGTSYSIVIDAPGRDRTFLHHPGCNDAFELGQLADGVPEGADILHFGYPPLMARTYADGGAALAREFGRLRADGVTVSLDMAMPDPAGASGKVGWRAFLTTVLPRVDVFLPSWDECWYMLRGRVTAPEPTLADLTEVGDELLSMGPAVVGLKLGRHGLYLRTHGGSRAQEVGRHGLPEGWARREALSPNFEVTVLGTTGAGDATIAGLLAALRRRTTFEDGATVASAVGASCVEGPGAEAGVRSWDETVGRVRAGWGRGGRAPESGWFADAASGLLLGPRDEGGAA